MCLEYTQRQLTVKSFEFPPFENPLREYLKQLTKMKLVDQQIIVWLWNRLELNLLSQGEISENWNELQGPVVVTT